MLKKEDGEAFMKEHPFTEWYNVATIVRSRSFGMTINDKHTHCMAPYSDLLNHRNPPDVRWTFNTERQGMVMLTFHDMKKG